MLVDEGASDTTFESLGVCSTLVKACQGLGYTNPTPIQRESLPSALAGKDVIGLAETGSGKTAAFAIPVLQSLLETPSPLFALVLAPTRELAYQIGETFEGLGASMGAKVLVITGGMDTMEQSLALSKRPHVIVATPGRLVQHLRETKGFSLKAIKFLVFDEADRLLHLDFEEEINIILKQLPTTRQTFLFSATMTSKVSKLQRTSLSNPVRVQVSTKFATVSTLIQNYLFLPAKYKDCYLVYLLNEFAGNSAVVFCHTCASTEKISLLLRSLGFPAIPLNGNMSQQKRLGSLHKFKSGDRGILVATDVASRGLDIPAVDIVVNYDVPANAKDYVHRVGRTARAGKAGRALTLVTQYDVELVQRIEKLTGEKMELYPTEKDVVLILQERVTEAQRYAQMTMKENAASQKGKKKKRARGDHYDEGDGASVKKTNYVKKKRR